MGIITSLPRRKIDLHFLHSIMVLPLEVPLTGTREVSAHVGGPSSTGFDLQYSAMSYSFSMSLMVQPGGNSAATSTMAVNAESLRELSLTSLVFMRG